MKSSIPLLVVASLLMVNTASTEPARPATGFKVGQVFPNLALPSLADGRPLSLADFRGQKLILHIFASW
ncbi:MAG: TlpA family protein disulfide reductase [Terriglobia bacterium]